LDALAPGVRIVGAGLAYGLGYGCALAAFVWLARRRGLATEGIAWLVAAGLIGGLAGANLVQWLVGGVPGKSILGGIACGWLAVLLAKRALGLRRPTGDLFALALAGGEAVGRFGCFIGGCCYGKLATVPWAVYDHGAWRHPTQLYLALAAGLTFAVLVWLERKAALPENGLFAVQGLLLCGFRFSIEFYRDVPATVFGLTTAQLACLAGLVVFATVFARLPRREALA
jgi:phosphatidylglycerol:prolipoprotein diacylglycerol transferase